MNGENDKNIPQDKENMPDVKREGWNVGDIAEEGANENPDEVVRRVLRDDSGKTAGDDKDIAGSSDSADTPQGHEEKKTRGEIKQING